MLPMKIPVLFTEPAFVVDPTFVAAALLTSAFCVSVPLPSCTMPVAFSEPALIVESTAVCAVLPTFAFWSPDHPPNCSMPVLFTAPALMTESTFVSAAFPTSAFWKEPQGYEEPPDWKMPVSFWEPALMPESTAVEALFPTSEFWNVNPGSHATCRGLPPEPTKESPEANAMPEATVASIATMVASDDAALIPRMDGRFRGRCVFRTIRFLIIFL
jgi:hypothetical protein